MRFALLFLMLLATQGILNLQGQEVERYRGPILIELPGKIDYRYAGFIAAVEKGFFEDAGYEVELSFGKTKEEIHKKLLQGEAIFSVCGSEIVLDHHSGKEVIATAAYFQRSPTVLVLKQEGSSTWLKEKAGYKLVFERKEPIEVLNMFHVQGLTVDDFKIDYNTNNKINRFKAGQIDGFESDFLIDYHYLKPLEMEYHIYNSDHFGAEFYDQVLYTSSSFYEKIKNDVDQFNEVVTQGWDYTLHNRGELINLLIDKYNFSDGKNLLHHQHWTVNNRLILPNLVNIGRMKGSRWANIQKTYAENGFLPEGYNSTDFYHKRGKLKRGVLSTYYVEIITAVSVVFLTLIIMIVFNRKLMNMVNKRTTELAEVNWQLSKFNEELENKIHDRTKELENALSKAEVANKAKSTFLANMTHEIRTPMNSILGFTQILKEKSHDPEIQKYLETINTSGQSLLRIINDVLDLSRVESGKFTLDYSRFNILRLIEETMNMYAEDVLSKNITMKFDHIDECPEFIYLDKDRLRQVLINIIGNAVKFTEEGLVEVKLTLEMVGPKDADVTIEVKDTGIGIPKENLESIFGQFEQAYDIHMHYGGTGLGLAIAKQLVEMMNGTLEVNSTEGLGADFKISLSKVGIVDEADEVEAEKKKQYHFEPAKVMVVDECQVTRDLFEAYLSVTRLTVRSYESSFDALKDLSSFKPNLIITEINMRSMDGFQLAEEIRAKDAFKKVPIIAISPITHTGSRQKFRIFNGFLKKPISVYEFYHSLSHFLPCQTVDNIEVKEVFTNRNKVSPEAADFRAFINRDIREKCTQVMKFQVINDYLSLQKQLKKIAADNDLHALKAWTEEFQKNLDVFNFEALNRQLEYLMNNKDNTI